MSRAYDQYEDVDDVRPNATCADCGADYSRADHDPTTTCDPCSDRRDAWATLAELRMVQAAAPTAPSKAVA